MSPEINKSLGLRDITDVNTIDMVPSVVEKKPHVPQTTVEEDYDYVRANLKEVIEHGQDALENLIDIADQSQHPRAYEVISTLINTIAAANKDLMEIAKKKKELTAEDKKEGPQTINNNLILTTADLQKLISGKKELS
jgi:predicted house-cleaning noncanonical NTP pyrophosphatase (MazG superfamily)